MSTRFTHLTGIILDWAGTVVDHGSLAPVAAMRHLFAGAGIEVTTEEIRAPMGLHKKEHIRAIVESKGSPADVDDLYANFIPRQMESLVTHSDVIRGAGETVARLRSRGLKIGSTTGYNRAMLDRVIEHARTQGYAPDCALCPDDVGGGRPMPWMCYEAAVRMRVFPMRTLVKIGDTDADIAEGRNAGTWTIGVTRTGNEIGLSESEWNALPADRQTALLTRARDRLGAAGADYLIDSVADVEPILDMIDARLARGERPPLSL
jgi:phosphonoacetaldehyde hydrolase